VQVFCPESSSTVGGCYWKEDGNKKWNVFVEEKVWLNNWQTWFSDDEPGQFTTITAESKLASILTIGYRYEKVSAALTVLPKLSYSFSLPNNIPPLTAEREEIDATVSYAVFPELQIGIGFKRANSKIIFPTGGDYDYTMNGLSLNLGGQVCLANLLGRDFSMFGTFSYGALKTQWKDGNNDYTPYHSTDLGLSWGLPPLGQLKPEVRLGYRAQTFYTETPTNDSVDTIEGFTLGLRLVF